MTAPRKIAVLIPGFPGQTHSFFWREIEALDAFHGIGAQIVSTRLAPKPVWHDWVEQAGAIQLYPVPKAELARLLPGLAAMVLYYLALGRTPASRATLAELAFPLTAALVGVVAGLRQTQADPEFRAFAGVLSTPISPPISSIRRLEMTRPRPVPPGWRLSELSAWLNA